MARPGAGPAVAAAVAAATLGLAAAPAPASAQGAGGSVEPFLATQISTVLERIETGRSVGLNTVTGLDAGSVTVMRTFFLGQVPCRTYRRVTSAEEGEEAFRGLGCRLDDSGWRLNEEPDTASAPAPAAAPEAPAPAPAPPPAASAPPPEPRVVRLPPLRPIPFSLPDETPL